MAGGFGQAHRCKCSLGDRISIARVSGKTGVTPGRIVTRYQAVVAAGSGSGASATSRIAGAGWAKNTAGGSTNGRSPPGVRLGGHRAAVGRRQQVVAQHLAGRARSHDLAAHQQHQLVGQRRGEVEVVHHGEHGCPRPACRRTASSTRRLVGEVEVGGGLVEQQAARLAGTDRGRGELAQGPGDVHALALAARQMDVKAVRKGGQADSGRAPRSPAACVRRRRRAKARAR